jgi:hypothetical protein
MRNSESISHFETHESIEKYKIPKEEMKALNRAWNYSLDIAKKDLADRSKIIPGGIFHLREELRKIQEEIKDSQEVEKKHQGLVEKYGKAPGFGIPKDMLIRIEARKILEKRFDGELDELWQISSDNIDLIVEEFKKYEIWAHEFTTSVTDKVSDISPEDSWYYETVSGMTIRFKNACRLYDGLSGVVVTPMEKIIFYDYDNKKKILGSVMSEKFPESFFSHIPIKGYRVAEYCSKGFISSLKDSENMNEDYESGVGFKKNDDIIEVLSDAGGHDGHLVNVILK